MKRILDHLGLAMDTPLAVPTSGAFRPPSWPPPKDWVCIEDKDGKAVARYGDHQWNFWPWAGKNVTVNFGDGPKLNARSHSIDPSNAELLRRLVTWWGWGPRGVRSVHSLLIFFNPIRKIIALCSENNVLASELSRYPVLIEKAAQTISPSNYEKIVAELERLRDAKDFLGFELLDEAGIRLLKAAQPNHQVAQTEYIAPRIWTYVVRRVKECVDDYLAEREKIEACFAFYVSLYEQSGVSEHQARTTRGSFADVVQRFGFKKLLERWGILTTGNTSINSFSSYLRLVQVAALADIVAFTLMRIDEAAGIRKDCLVWHDDPVYGRIPLIQAETTKTDRDEKALWVTSPSIEAAVCVLTSIAKLRLSCLGRWSEDSNPYLITHAAEPWCRWSRMARLGLRPTVLSLREFTKHYPKVFDIEQLTITPDDLRIAKIVSPTLDSELFQVGKPWPLAWHQFRRTGAVNMFASGEISDSTIQLQMKHLTRLMPLYYGRGNSALHLNDSARVALVNAQYETMARQLAEVHTSRFVSPHGDEHKSKLLASANAGEPVSLITEGDLKHYEKAARKHLINFRQTALGGCMKNGQCDGDCISSVGDCAGADGKSPCAHVLFDRNRMAANQIRLDGVSKQLEATPSDTPRYRALEQEKRGLENYFAYIRKS